MVPRAAPPTSPSPSVRPRVKPRTILILAAIICWLAATALLACLEIQDPDIGQHIAAGRILLDDFGAVRNLTMGQSPEVLRFAYSYWLYQMMIATVFDHLGPGMVVVLRALLIVGTFLLVLLLAHRLQAEGWACAIGLAIALLIAHDRFLDRPELLSYLAWTVALWILMRHRRDRSIWLLIPLQILWVNSHLWFALLPILFVTVAIGNQLDRRGDLRRDAVLLGALILASFAGPAGPGAWLSQMEIVQFLLPGKSFPFAIQEMVGPYAAYQPRLAVWVFRIGMPVCLALAVLARRRLGWGVLLTLLLAAILATRARRAMPLFGLTAGALLPVALTAIKAALPRNAQRTLPQVLAACTLLFGGIGIYSLASGRYFLEQDHDTRIALRIHPRFPALKAARFLREGAVEGVIFHNAVAAGAIVLENGTRLTPFLDARWAGTDETTALYQRIRQATEETIATEWEALCELRGIETVLLDFYEMPALLGWISQDPRWAAVYVDETTAIFCRRRGRNQKVIDQYEPPITRARAAHDPERDAALAEAALGFLRSAKPALWKPLTFPYGAFHRSNYALQIRSPYDAQVAFLDLLDTERGSLQVSNHRIDVLNNILWTLLETDQAAAIAALSEELANSPEIDEARRPSLRLRQARALEQLGETDRVEEIARAVVGDPAATPPDRWAAWCRVADVRSSAQDYEGAVDALRHAVQEDPASAETYRAIGGILELKLSRPAEALESYERFRALGGEDPLVEERIRLLREQGVGVP